MIVVRDDRKTGLCDDIHDIQGVSGEIVNILGSGIIDNSE
jgi:hypothetical protein